MVHEIFQILTYFIIHFFKLHINITTDLIRIIVKHWKTVRLMMKDTHFLVRKIIQLLVYYNDVRQFCAKLHGRSRGVEDINKMAE